MGNQTSFCSWIYGHDQRIAAMTQQVQQLREANETLKSKSDAALEKMNVINDSTSALLAAQTLTEEEMVTIAETNEECEKTWNQVTSNYGNQDRSVRWLDAEARSLMYKLKEFESFTLPNIALNETQQEIHELKVTINRLVTNDDSRMTEVRSWVKSLLKQNGLQCGHQVDMVGATGIGYSSRRAASARPCPPSTKPGSSSMGGHFHRPSSRRDKPFQMERKRGRRRYLHRDDGRLGSYGYEKASNMSFIARTRSSRSSPSESSEAFGPLRSRSESPGGVALAAKAGGGVRKR